MESRANTSAPKSDKHSPKKVNNFFGADLTTPNTILTYSFRGGVYTKSKLDNHTPQAFNTQRNIYMVRYDGLLLLSKAHYQAT